MIFNIYGDIGKRMMELFLDGYAIAAELKKYDQALYDKPRWLVLNKTDMLQDEEREQALKRFLKAYRWKGKWFAISALTGAGCRELCFAIMDHLTQEQGT